MANTCDETQTYAMQIALADGFQQKAPGNSVTSYVSQVANADELPLTDPFVELKDAIDTGDYPSGTGGTALCVTNTSLLGKYSQWLKADVELITTGFTSDAGLPAAGSTYSTFTSDVYESGSACATANDPAVTQGSAVVYVKSKSCTEQGATACTAP